jgi:tetratricopeptide (TPR) repeat protein
MENKNYLEATALFDKINKEDEQRYTLAKEKSAECKRLFIADKLEKAKNEATNKNYLEGIKYLDSALEIDNANSEVLKVKSEYTALYINTNLEQAKKEAAAAKYSEALKTLDLVLKIDPNNSEALKLKEDYNKAAIALKEKKTTTTAVKKATTSVVKTNGAPPVKRPSETQRQPVSFAQGSEAVRNEFKKMGFVFSSDTTAMYSEDGIEIGIVDRGDLWQVATKVWGPDVESIFFGCVTIVRGRDTAFNTRFLLYNALDYGGVHSVGNIKAFVNDDMLVMHIGYPGN